MEGEWQPKILMVDSDERALAVIKNFLVSAGFEVTTAWSAETASDLLQSSEYDLVLVDDRFADLTSGCFLVHLQQCRKRAPVVVMEGSPSRPCGVTRHNSLRAGRFVNKWRPCEVLEAAREMLPVPPVPKTSPSEG